MTIASYALQLVAILLIAVGGARAGASKAMGGPWFRGEDLVLVLAGLCLATLAYIMRVA